MLTDLALASLHHLLFFGLVSMLVAQSVLLRGRMDAGVLGKLGFRRVAEIDSGEDGRIFRWSLARP